MMSYASAGQDHIGSYIVKDVCMYYPKNMYNWEGITEESHYCMVVLIQQYRLVPVNICNLEF